MCCVWGRSRLEDARFQALIDLVDGTERGLCEIRACSKGARWASFLPSVLVQQTFSILKQSPTGAIRLGDLRRVAPESFDEKDLRRILGHLSQLDFLRSERLGEWRPGKALDELVDAHEIYSNIGSDPLSQTLVDAYSGRTLAPNPPPPYSRGSSTIGRARLAGRMGGPLPYRR